MEVDDAASFALTNKCAPTLRTSAIGDIVGQPMLAHKGVHEGHVAAEVISGLKHYFDPESESIHRLH